MATITLGDETLFPLLVLGLESTQSSGNIVHPILSRNSPDVTFGAHGLRTGTLELLAASLVDAEALRLMHLQSGIFTLEEEDLPFKLNYVPSGDITVALEDDTRELWLVSIDFQEVTV